MFSKLASRLRRVRWTRGRIVTWSAIVVIIAGLLIWNAIPSRASFTTTPQFLTVMTGPNGTTPVKLDTTFYEPKSASAAHPVPAVLLAHGFGGTKDSVVDQAKNLADRGYAVMTWTAEGFGASGGQVHLDSPDWEVKDGSDLIDWLAKRPEIVHDSADDPRVAAVGGSYGGGFSLMLAGDDPRVDAIVPMITWNNLATAFLPDSVTGGTPATGVWKKAWAGIFFSDTTPNRANPSCGKFAEDLCQAYLSIASTGVATPAQIALLDRSSPSSVISRIKAPTLLIQGEADTLFPLDQADANAAGIAANGTPVSLAWFTGGHDGGSGPQSDQDRLTNLTDNWLDFYLKHTGPKPSSAFTYSRIAGLDANSNGLVASAFSVASYPGLTGQSRSTVAVLGPAQAVANPPGGSPAALSSLPGTGTSALSTLVKGIVTDIPGQHADFYSAPLTRAIDVVGSPTVAIKVASATGSAVVFVKLYDVDPASGLSLPDGLVAPVRLTGLPDSLADPVPVTVTLPAIVHQFPAGHRLRITVATSDQAFLSPGAPNTYQVSLDDGALTLPTVAATAIASGNASWWWALAALVVFIALAIAMAIVIARRRRRHRVRSLVTEFADTPLVIRGLRKEYGDFVAVSMLDLTVARGQVLGLLGPNGAGKTTTLRVLMGLTQPTAGEIYVYGHRLLPGSPVLSRVGALVEGPGFLPHLSGRDNLRLYWRATGRPEAEARMDEALEIAGLGSAVDRRTKTYSHGMRQRLAIAQAMLGLPELLVLDEPTDGLDPPQIAEMRRVLRRYATDGRAVLVSSHLLAEVEQTCTHVVVMHKGEKVADGPVDDIVGESPSVQFDVSDVAAASAVFDGIDGIRSVTPDGAGLVVDADGVPRADLVAALVNAGIGVDRVAPRRRLEDAFLALVGGDTKASGER